MKPIVRSALFCFALALLLPFTALAADGDSADEAPTVTSRNEVAMTPLDPSSVDQAADQAPSWLEPPAWTKDEVTVSFGNCPGPPVLSCQCGPGLGEPGSEACCYCNTCWDGYVLALCGLDP